MGLEPLAKKIMAFPTKGSLSDLVKEFPYDLEVSLTGAKYIISEWISDNAYYRKLIKNEIFFHGSMESKLKKNASDERLFIRCIMIFLNLFVMLNIIVF